MRLGAITLALLVSGCSGSGLFSSAGDWSAYRATRVAPTFELRLDAAHRYLKDRPDGSFHHEVRAWFEHAEEVFYNSKKDSRTGLDAYLDALPEGPHKDEAIARLADMNSRRSEVEKLAADVEARVGGPTAAARARLRTELAGWLGRFLDPAAFQAPLSEAKAGVVIPFSLSLPKPRCAWVDPPPTSAQAASRRCTKLLELPYEVEGKVGTESREATMEVTVLEDGFGTPLEVTIAGPDLFLRLEETYRVKALAPDDAAQRKTAASRAVTLVKRAFGRVVSSADACTQIAQAPAALRLACEGVQVEVFPTPTPGGDDLIVIVPVVKPPPR